jgi:hypothetical protein
MKKAIYFVTTMALMSLSMDSFAQEHPEHPEKSEEHPTSSAELSVEDLAVAVKDYVNDESEKGYFIMKDEESGKKLKLTLDKVHKERLSALGDDTYFVCADFKGTDGNTYDVDIFMKGENKEALVATDRSVHKVNGKERYTWHEVDGVWKKKKL